MNLGQNFVKYFVCFLGNRVSRKSAFEINWPLCTHCQFNFPPFVVFMVQGCRNQLSRPLSLHTHTKFWQIVNPIPTRAGGWFCPPFTSGTLSASLQGNIPISRRGLAQLKYHFNFLYSHLGFQGYAKHTLHGTRRCNCFFQKSRLWWFR